ncbi:MAG: hypothetical protein JNG88_03270 [Phycisphaerales bacterium]|nr:hypothetical protein [Phycisphaerales bacterium]
MVAAHTFLNVRRSWRGLPLILIASGVLAVSNGAETLRVPAEYATIGEAIAAAQDGDTVLVADGVYSGSGNTNLSFAGKAILVRSENGAVATSINLAGTTTRAFRFENDEQADSILRGFTIMNANLRHDQRRGLLQ